jgi:hypothetical protein
MSMGAFWGCCGGGRFGVNFSDWPHRAAAPSEGSPAPRSGPSYALYRMLHKFSGVPVSFRRLISQLQRNIAGFASAAQPSGRTSPSMRTSLRLYTQSASAKPCVAGFCRRVFFFEKGTLWSQIRFVDLLLEFCLRKTPSLVPSPISRRSFAQSAKLQAQTSQRFEPTSIDTFVSMC